MRKRRSIIIFGSIAVGALTLAACVGPPTPESIASEFATPIEPVWEVDVPGLYGEPAIRDGVVLAYAADDEVGLRLTAHALEDGALLWEHASSPGGAFGAGFFSGVNSAGRTYPLPAIEPLVIDVGIDDDGENGEEAAPAVVFFEPSPEGGYRPDDLIHVADLHTGELLELSLPEYDPDDFSFEPLGLTDAGEIFATTYTPGYPCGVRLICWVAPEYLGSGLGSIRLDTSTLELRFEDGHVPEPANRDESLGIDWGLEYAHITNDDTVVARYRDGVELWRVGAAELFDDPRAAPADFVDFVEVGDLVLIQGYHPILETLSTVHTLSIDYAESRTLVAVDAETGDVAWRLRGGDMLCHAVHERPIPTDAETIPICQVTGGGYVFDLVDDEMVEDDPIVASIAELTVADGELGWEVEDAGVVSIAHVVRLLDVIYAARGDLTVTEIADEGSGLLDLRDGAWYPVPAEGSAYVCKAERDDIDLEFERGFAGGANPISPGYPAGWYHFACDDEGAESDVFTKGAVRVAGYPAGENRVVLPLEGSLVAFDL